jgi:hypothetical protein
MSGEWMKVMLEEISRKKTEDDQARAEERRRGDARRQSDERGQGEPQQHDNAQRTARSQADR